MHVSFMITKQLSSMGNPTLHPDKWLCAHPKVHINDQAQAQ
jgi:hypothetical protein